MNPWLVALLVYLGLALITFLPVLWSVLRRVRLHNGGDGPAHSPLLSKTAKTRLQQNHSRLLETLGFWKKQAEIYKRFHFYSLGWVIPSSLLVPFLAQVVTEDPYSKWFLSTVAAMSAILLSFQKWLKAEQNYKAFRMGESTYYDLRRQLLDRPQSFGHTEEAQLEPACSKYNMLYHHTPAAEYDKRQRTRILRGLRKRATSLGFELVEASTGLVL